MRKFSLFLFLRIVLFTSCQKEISWDLLPPVTPPTDSTDTVPTNPDGTLLVKSVSVENGETYTVDYSYDADKRIEVMRTTGIINGIDAGEYRRFYRDAIGRIVRIAIKIPDQAGESIDTIFTDVHYPNSTSFNYDYTVRKYEAFGLEIGDSAVYTYNASNQITEYYDYQTSGSIGILQTSKIVHTYDASGNITSMDQYNDISGSSELVQTIAMEYDDKTNPLSLDKQPLLVSLGNPGTSHNNLVVIKFIIPGQPDVINNISYTYLSNGYPSVITQVDITDNNATTVTTMYYR